jgi:hypothetical protein
MNTNSSVEILQYGCRCGKEFSGEPKKINMILRLHYKKCKYEYIKVKESDYVVSVLSSDRPRSSKKNVAGVVEAGKGQKLIDNVLFSS